MMQVQIEIAVRGNDNNTIAINLLEREDANDTERELARNIQNMIMAVMEDLRDHLPAGDVQIEGIEPAPRCPRCGSALNNVAPGYSVVRGGQAVCAGCLRPCEEVARARGIE